VATTGHLVRRAPRRLCLHLKGPRLDVVIRPESEQGRSGPVEREQPAILGRHEEVGKGMVKNERLERGRGCGPGSARVARVRHAQPSSAKTGSAIPNSAPPAGRGRAQIRPPIASTSARHTNSPIPAPLLAAVPGAR